MSSAAPAPAAEASRLLRRGPEGERDGRVNDKADVLGRLVRKEGRRPELREAPAPDQGNPR
ncbi:hypothetical protein GCM10010307_68800 [Streptomyces vastus]|uniref:Uncharacterized protein n=1 Tax=Streptomyces vastus TaxID=285451 RepID=A0ABP6E3L7_9ACTN